MADSLEFAGVVEGGMSPICLAGQHPQDESRNMIALLPMVYQYENSYEGIWNDSGVAMVV
jgi:hypothetical protein